MYLYRAMQQSRSCVSQRLRVLTAPCCSHLSTRFPRPGKLAHGPPAHSARKLVLPSAAQVETAAPAKDDKEASSRNSGKEAAKNRAKRAYLIYNPVAGQEDPEHILGQIAMKLSEEYQYFTVCQTKPDVSAEELTKQALDEGADLIVASGGDGTVGAVAGECSVAAGAATLTDWDCQYRCRTYLALCMHCGDHAVAQSIGSILQVRGSMRLVFAPCSLWHTSRP